MADGGEHPAYLAVAALENREFHFRLSRAIRTVALMTAAQAHILRGLGRTIFESDAPAQDVQRFLRGNAAHFCAIRFGDMVARMGQLVEKLPIVREKNQAFRVYVEAAHRAQHWLVSQIYQLRDQTGGMGILKGRHHSARLVEGDVITLARQMDGTAIERNLVGVQIYFGSQFRNDVTVNLDPALGDPRFAGPARSDSGGCERLLKPF